MADKNPSGKRRYTMTDAAKGQRRKASQEARKHATGPVTPEGKAAVSRNGWKHGQYASTIARQVGKPCLSTCPDYEHCELVTGGQTAPGKDCLDKVQFVQAFRAVIQAVEEGKAEDLNLLLAGNAAKNLEILNLIQNAILGKGSVIEEELFDKDGNLIGKKIKSHPNLADLSKLITSLGIGLDGLKITPKSRDDDGGKGAASNLADALSDVAKALGKKK